MFYSDYAGTIPEKETNMKKLTFAFVVTALVAVLVLANTGGDDPTPECGVIVCNGN
jgi:hypothetical protein